MRLISEYLAAKGYEWRRRGDNAIMNCPFCDDKERKFAINLKTGCYNCLHLNNCGKKGNFYDFQRALGDEPERMYPKTGFAEWSRKKTFTLPKTKLVKPTQDATDYLHARGISDATIHYFHIKSLRPGVVSFPYYRDGEIINIKHMMIERIDGKKKMWSETGAEPILFNRDNIIGEEITICEGEIDCMSLVQCGIPAVSVPMGAKNFDWLESEWEYISMFNRIYLCFDNDKVGQEAENTLVQKLGSWRCFHVSLPKKDANECLTSGINQEVILECFANATDYQPSLLALPSDFRDDIQDLFKNPDALNGTKTPWASLDDLLKGWRSEELTVWTGRGGSGKSTIINQVVIDLAKKGERSCIASLEMPAKRYIRWAVVQYLGNHNPAPRRIDDALTWFTGKIYIVNTFEEIEPGPLLDVFEYAARRHHIKHFVVDSLMRVVLSGKDTNSAQKDFVSSLVSFAKKFSCHIHLVAHPRKGLTDQDKPGKVDVSGSGDITNLSHNVLSVWRPDQDYKDDAIRHGKVPSDLVLFVKKNREFGIEGKIKLWFDVAAKTYRETPEKQKPVEVEIQKDNSQYEF